MYTREYDYDDGAEEEQSRDLSTAEGTETWAITKGKKSYQLAHNYLEL